MNWPTWIGLLLTGTIAGLDLVSGPQVLLARPIVVGTLSGLLLGDVTTGILVGGVLELFALEVLPVGATRYPDHGPGTVGAVWLTVQAGTASAGFGVLHALLIAELGGVTLIILRRLNGRALASATAALDRGDPQAAAALQIGGAARDAMRSLLLTLLALGAARLVLPLVLAAERANTVLAVVVVTAGFAGAAAGAFRTAGRSRRTIVLVAALIIGWAAGGMAGIFPRVGSW
ncbi:MAG TPA: PTS sugar transporter subunit IIC [Gemmatimonadales bacterium]|nr:PTS sugar transporter subunit IIC [Gemmatimonadales bacterium]